MSVKSEDSKKDNKRKIQEQISNQSNSKKLLAESEAVTDDFYETDLHKAVRLGNVPEVERLICSDVDKDATDSNGQTPLHLGVRMRQTTSEEILRCLLNSGVNLDLRDGRGKTPLHISVDFVEYVSVKALIKAGAKLYLRDNNGETPLEAIVGCTLGHRIGKILVNNGAIVAEMDNLFKNGKKNDTAFCFSKKIKWYSDIRRDEDAKAFIKYALLYFPKINTKHFRGYDLHAYHCELNRMKSVSVIEDGDCSISLHSFLLKEDKNLWTSFVTYLKSKSFAEVKRFYTDKYPIYANVIMRKMVREMEKQLLLSKVHIVMNHSELGPLPYLPRSRIIRFLRESDLQSFISSVL